MDKAAAADLLAGDPVKFASNTLIIVTAPGNPENIVSFRDLNQPGLSVVVCAPQVPCGSAAEKIEHATGIQLNPVSEESQLEGWQRFIGSWKTEGVHPMLPGEAIRGTSTFEWLDGRQFVIWRSQYEHDAHAMDHISDEDLTAVAESRLAAACRPGYDLTGERVRERDGEADDFLLGGPPPRLLFAAGPRREALSLCLVACRRRSAVSGLARARPPRLHVRPIDQAGP
jgi:hypothetical protein